MRSAAVMRSGVGAEPAAGSVALVELPEDPGGVASGQQGLAPGHGLGGVVQLGRPGVGIEAAPGADPDRLVAVSGLVGAAPGRAPGSPGSGRPPPGRARSGWMGPTAKVTTMTSGTSSRIGPGCRGPSVDSTMRRSSWSTGVRSMIAMTQLSTDRPSAPMGRKAHRPCSRAPSVPRGMGRTTHRGRERPVVARPAGEAGRPVATTGRRVLRRGMSRTTHRRDEVRGRSPPLPGPDDSSPGVESGPRRPVP